MDLNFLPPLANCIRALAMDAVEVAQSGHPGMPMGMADVATVLYARHLKFYPHNPHWPDRDRLILSGGHGSMLLYAAHHLVGYAPMTMEEIKRFRQLGSRTPGHLERDVEAGVEMTTGPLGQGLGSAVGFALAERLARARFGDSIVNHRTYVMCGDGDLQEGISHEACALAGHWKLNNLIVLYDDNHISIDGATDLSFSEDVPARFAAYGWAVKRVDGHDMAAVDSALTWAKAQDRPVLIACRTTIGFGAPTKAGSADCHGSPLGAAEIAGARVALNWPHAPFVIPEDLLNAWRSMGARGRADYTAWEQRLAGLEDDKRQEFIESQAGVNGAALERAIADIMAEFSAKPPTIATRKASQMVLEKLVSALPNLIGGSADLTGSNLTKVSTHVPYPSPCHPGHDCHPGEGRDLAPLSQPGPGFRRDDNHQIPYIHYGVREHGMAAIMNGIALHGGFVPYGGTFLTFSDYCRPSIRLAALMKCQSIFVMTHDSIGLGEDGPTHQPVEHLASLRAIPNCRVFRPADAIETAECWALALNRRDGPSILALTRQNVKPLRTDTSENKSVRGAYILSDAPNPRVLIWASGSEVEIALQAQEILKGDGIAVRVVSAPSLDLFMQQDDAYKQTIFADIQIQVAVEAGVRHGWDRVIDWDGIFIGMTSFGESAPAEDLYVHFGITADNVVNLIKSKIYSN